MRSDEEIYTVVLRRVAEVDNGWGKPYAFGGLFVLDHAVPGVENPETDFNGPTREQPFGEALRAVLCEQLADLPLITFVQDIFEVYDGSRKGPKQVRDGGGFIALGPIDGDDHLAVVCAMFYGGHLWARWLRYHLERVDEMWRITSTKVLLVS